MSSIELECMSSETTDMSSPGFFGWLLHAKAKPHEAKSQSRIVTSAGICDPGLHSLRSGTKAMVLGTWLLNCVIWCYSGNRNEDKDQEHCDGAYRGVDHIL